MAEAVDQTYLDKLNDVQRQAVTATEGPVLVVAGPGSGKTRVLTVRIAHLIQQGVRPWEILALTFTNKASREMKERIARVVGAQAERVWAGTFHSIFARILRVEADKIGYPSNFTIYDTEDTKSVISAIIREMNLDKESYNVNALRTRISSAKSNLITPKTYADDPELTEQDRLAKRPYTREIYAKYVARCKRSGAMDFDDLLYRLYELLQNHPEVRRKYQDKFRYLLVDEFQDTNTLQYAIIKKMVDYRTESGEVDRQQPRNICVVGDDAQSIYAFRGATIQNILDFEEDFKPFGIRVFKLEQNYRSTDPIVQAANAVIRNNRRQIQKKIWSDKGDGQRIRLLKAMTDGEEGKLITDIILEQKNRDHLSNEEIAILYRTNAQSRVFEEYLRRFNIPYRVFGGLSFYQRKEVKDLIAYLRLAVNPNDEEALRRVINYPKRGLGRTTVDKISSLAGQTDQTMWAVIPRVQVGPRARKALDEFVAMIKDFGRRAIQADAYQAASHIAKRSKLLDTLKADTTIEGMNRLENVNGLLDGISAFVSEGATTAPAPEADHDASLAAYLQNIALLTDLDSEDKSGDFVTLMSVHAAKGLEFKSVFVVGLEEKLFPSFLAMDSEEGLDEERRLFYVAITRAEAFLTLSFANSRYRYGQMRYNEPSRFLSEVPQEMLDAQSSSTAGGGAAYEGGGGKARISGAFQRRTNAQSPVLRADPKTFKPSPSSEIQVGMKVLHLKFGEGKVLSIDGAKGNRVATIFFQDIDNPQRRIMLKFAKLQIL